MNKRAWLNIGLLAAVAVLAAIAYFKPGDKGEQEAVHLTALAPQDIQRLEITQKDGRHIVLARGKQGWMIEQPIKAPANEFRIDPLLNVLRATSYAHFPIAGVDLEQLGLAPPLGILKAGGVELRFGTTEPIDQRRYVMIGDTVHLIADDYYYSLQAQLPAFVSNRLLPDTAEPLKIALPDFTLERARPGADWKVSPARKGVGPDAINAFVDEWRQAQAIEVSAYESGPAAAADKIEVTLGGGERREFLIVARDPELILARADIGMQYRFPADQGERLMRLEPIGGGDGEK